jgi:nucleotide sugar dehydrogenase
VVYESTVYPGVTEDVCIPVLEKASGLKWKVDFNVGYSPERINPGDKERRFDNILKIVAGDTPETLDVVDGVYKAVVTAGTHRAPSIRVAEFAKVLENTQRDINIALINEIALICDRLGVDTQDVLKAAGTKWNFLPFRPGLVGGHCIGVDPFYIAHKAEEVGYHPHVIHSGRRVNDGMGVMSPTGWPARSCAAPATADRS